MTDQEKNALRLKNLKDDYRKVFLATKQGRRVLLDILQYSGLLASVYDKDHSRMSFNEGKRDVGLIILSLLDKRTFEGLEELENAGLNLTDIFGGQS